jgi:hypothetical protein
LAYAYHGTLDLSKIKNDYSTEDNQRTQDYFKKTFSKKIQKDQDFKITIAIARTFTKDIRFKTQYGHFAGLIYHTTRLENNSDNVALKKEVIDSRRLQLQGIEYIEIIEKIGNVYHYKLIDYAEEVKNGLIQWKELKSTWTFSDESENLIFDENNFFTIDGTLLAPLAD